MALREVSSQLRKGWNPIAMRRGQDIYVVEFNPDNMKICQMMLERGSFFYIYECSLECSMIVGVSAPQDLKILFALCLAL